MRASKRRREAEIKATTSAAYAVNLCGSSSAASQKTVAASIVKCAEHSSTGTTEVINLCSSTGPPRHANRKDDARPGEVPRRRKHRRSNSLIGLEDAIAPYIRAIDCHLTATEEAHRSRPGFMSAQEDLSASMRAILVDWLIDVHLKFQLLSETLHLAVNLLDRFLELVPVPRRKLQLVGCAAMFLASKYEEVLAPEARDFVFVSDQAFTHSQLLEMEGNILAALNFQLTSPSSLLFLQRFISVAELSQHDSMCSTPCTTEMLARYILELSLLTCEMQQHSPSKLAAAAFFLARQATGHIPWPSSLEEHTDFSVPDLTDCSAQLLALHSAAPSDQLQAVRKKYARQRCGAVSDIPLK